MTGHEGEEVIGSVQCCAKNKCDCGKASMTDHEGEEVIGLVQCCAIKECDCGKASITGHEGKRGYRFSAVLCYK